MNIEKEMKAKYGCNVDWLAEGCYHASPWRLVRDVKRIWAEFSDEEKAHMCGVYSMPGGFFEISKGEEGELQCVAKCNDQIALELIWEKNVIKDERKYEDALKNNKIELSNIEKSYMKNYIAEKNAEKNRK